MSSCGAFYRLSVELEKPGCFAIWETCRHDLDSPVAQHNLRLDAFPDFEPEFAPVELSDDSSLVDFVDGESTMGGQGLLVSEKVLRLLGEMRLPPYRPYRLEVIRRGTPVEDPYYWVQILTMRNYHWIDFARSEFSLISCFEMDDSRARPVKIDSVDGLERVLESNEDTYLLSSRLTLNGAYAARPYDLFYLDRLGGIAWAGPIVSERLKEALEREKAVGYRLRPLGALSVGQ
jgi:hypothetical protein